MKCDKCASEATVHVVEVIEGERKERHLCEEHGKSLLEAASALPFESWPDNETRVTVEVTQSRIDKGESVPIDVSADGKVKISLTLPPGIKDGDTFDLTPGEGEPACHVTVKIVREDQELGGGP